MTSDNTNPQLIKSIDDAIRASDSICAGVVNYLNPAKLMDNRDSALTAHEFLGQIKASTDMVQKTLQAAKAAIEG